MSSTGNMHAGDGASGFSHGTPRVSEDSVELLGLEAKFTQPDSVLEKPEDVLEALKEYLKAGGKVQTAVQHLSTEYMGYAAMADLVVEWADLVGMPLGPLLGPQAAGGSSSSSSLNKAYSIGPGSSRSLLSSPPAASAAGAAGAGAAAGQEGAHLDVLLLQELVKERFDPTKFLSVFKQGHPTWLDELIKHTHSRKMIYELSAANKNSLLLNYAIQRILKQGYEDEVAQVGASLASYFDVYHRLLASRLQAAAKAKDEKQLRSIAGEIVASSVDHQHTYVHAQQLLTALAQLPGGSVFRRLSQEVEAAAAERHGGIKVYQLQPLFLPRSAPALECQAAQLVSAILVASAPNLPGTGSAAQADAGKQQQQQQQQQQPFVSEQLAAAEQPLIALQQMYQQEPELSVQPLRHPRLMQLLLSGMYVASDAKPSAMSQQTCSIKELCIRLLALAVAGRWQQGHEPAQQQAGQQQNGHAQDVSAQQQQQQEGQLPSQQQEGQQQQQGPQRRSLSPEVKAHVGVEAVAGMLRKSLELTKRMASNKLGPRDLEAASQVCCLPVAVLGLLQHSQQLLSDEAVYGEERIIVMLPNHLSVLHRAACEQPGMIPKVLSVLRTVLGHLGAATHHELIRSVLSFLVSLIVSGAAGPTLDLVRDMSKKGMDPSLMRHFVELVLESVEPPYSEGFSRAMLELMAACTFTRVQSSHMSLLREFAAGCRDLPYRPPLSNDLQSLLDLWGN